MQLRLLGNLTLSMRFFAASAILLSSSALAILNASQNNASLTIANERLVASVSKRRGYVNVLTLDGQNLLVRDSLGAFRPQLMYDFREQKTAILVLGHIWIAIVLHQDSGHPVEAIRLTTSSTTAQTLRARNMAVSAWVRHSSQLVRDLSNTGF